MIVEVVTTGTELLLGQIVNTNAAWLAAFLNEQGYDVLYQSTVGDNPDRMEAVLTHALQRADIVITTGGLGPTQGDITKEISAKVIGRNMQLDSHSLQRIEKYFSARQLSMTDNNRRQAYVPEGALVLDNDRGTAPGIILCQADKVLVNLPGPPHECRWMAQEALLPWLRQQYGQQDVLISRILRVADMGESLIEDQLMDLIQEQSNPTMALLARPGAVQIRLTAKSTGQEEALALIQPLEQEIRKRLGEHICGQDAETLEVTAGAALRAGGFTVALAESCTGGLVTSRLTDIPGSSEYVLGGIISYSNEAKEEQLGVNRELLDKYGAVSPQVAKAMASKVRQNFRADFGVGITGIAGPGGGSAQKPVGLVYIAVAAAKGIQVEKYTFHGERAVIKERACQQALYLLYRQSIAAGTSGNGK